MAPGRLRALYTALVAVLVVSLAACSGGGNPTVDTTPAPTTGAPTAAQSPVTPADTDSPVTVYPAIGNVAGVVTHGTSNYDDHLKPGVTYTCAIDNPTINLQVGQTVDYNGAIISVVSGSPNPQAADDNKRDVFIDFSGNLQGFYPTVIIVHGAREIADNDDNKYVDDKLGQVPYNDGMLVKSLKLERLQFMPTGFISGVTLCLGGGA